MRPRIFIGSSKEALHVADKVKSFFEGEFDCKIWNDNFFELNKSTLDSLVRSAVLYDFAIIIWTKDDLATIRKQKFETPRDNVVFELGLFTGGLGIDKTFVLCEDKVKIPSDYNGITVSVFETHKIDDVVYPNDSIEEQLTTIKKKIFENINKGYLSLLPSTALSIAYYNNFVKRACDWIADNDNKASFPKFWRKKKYGLKIVKPKIIERDMNNKIDLLSKQKDLVKFQIKFKSKGRNLNVWKNRTNIKDNIVYFYDMPTTLSILLDSIGIFLNKQFVGNSNEEEYLKHREITNFFKVLEYYISKESVTQQYASIIEEESL